MLKANLRTVSDLKNDNERYIHYIIYVSHNRHPSLPLAIIATSNSYTGPSFRPGLAKSVLISPVTTDCHSQKINVTRRMLYIIIGYAFSIHKLHGTVSVTLILNAEYTEFGVGILLVGCTRTERFHFPLHKS